MTRENPTRHLGYLQQCLSSDKKPLGLFLGAGCPMAIRLGGDGGLPLIPGIAGMTQAVCTQLADCENCAPLIAAVRQQLDEDGYCDPTVEDILNHIRALRAAAGRAKVRGFSAEELDELDVTICQLIHNIANKSLPNTATPYHRVASWVEAIRRDSPVEVFTTNYDLLLEQAFEDLRVPYFDGFAGGRKPFFDVRAMEEDVLPPRWARLWKLHGSINWYQAPGKGVFRGTAEGGDCLKRVIHPSHLKYEESRRMPYLAMIDRLRAFLRQPTAALIICGYSFRDEHINEAIVQGLESTQTAIAFALLYGRVTGNLHAVTLARTCPNLSILARDGAVIGSHEVEWLGGDAESVPPDDSPWLRRVQVDPPDGDGRWALEFMLGDFSVFGCFLRELVGSVRQSEWSDVQ